MGKVRVELTGSAPTIVKKVRVYRDQAGEWRWTARSSNGRNLADSGEGYANHADAMKIAADLFPQAEVVEQDERYPERPAIEQR